MTREPALDQGHDRAAERTRRDEESLAPVEELLGEGVVADPCTGWLVCLDGARQRHLRRSLAGGARRYCATAVARHRKEGGARRDAEAVARMGRRLRAHAQGASEAGAAYPIRTKRT